MQLTVKELELEDKWKDIVRINKEFRKDNAGRRIPRGSVCRITVGSNSKWVILYGREPKDNGVQMDLNVRLSLDISANQAYEFSVEKLCGIRALWFPWKASDPMYRLPAQLSLVSFLVGVVLGVLGILVGVVPLLK